MKFPRPYNPNRGRCKAYCLADILMENQLGLSSLSAVSWVVGVWEGFQKLGSRLKFRRIAMTLHPGLSWSPALEDITLSGDHRLLEHAPHLVDTISCVYKSF